MRALTRCLAALLLAAFVWAPAPAIATRRAFAEVFTLTAGSTNGNGFTSAGQDTTGVDLFRFATCSYPGGGTPTFTDSASSSWNHLTIYATALTELRIHWAIPASTGTGHTFTTGCTSCFPSIGGDGVSGADATPFDAEDGATTEGSVFTLQPGALVPAADGSSIFSAVCHAVNQPTGFTVSGVTEKGDIANDGQHVGLAWGSHVQATAASINPQWSWVDEDGHAAVAQAVFAADGGGGGGPPSPLPAILNNPTCCRGRR